jgi:hypothetical protein
LFELTGIGIHPYPLQGDSDLPPDRTSDHNPNMVTFPQLSHLARAVNRIMSVYRSRKHLQIWNTEYGYITDPPNRSGSYPSPATAAYYLNWAEYLSWRNRRIQSFTQYLLEDPGLSGGGFDSGLLTLLGQPKQTYAAWILPLYLPRTSERRGRSLEVWGCVRPAYFAVIDTHQPQRADIQYKRAGTSSWTTIDRLTFTGSNCYFNVRIAFPASGTVRLEYSYPITDAALTVTTLASYVDPLAPAVSRTVSVTVK